MAFSHSSAENSEDLTARTSHPLLEVDETEVKGDESSEVLPIREEDGGSQNDKLPSAPPDTSKCRRYYL